MAQYGEVAVSRPRAALAGALIASGLLLAARGCRSASDGEPAHGSGGAAGSTDAAGSAGSGGRSGSSAAGGAFTGGTSGASTCAPASGAPPGLPPGWIEWTDYSCECRLYVPGPDAEPLPAVPWEPCPAGTPAVPGCRRILTYWTAAGNSSLSGFLRFWFDKSSGKAYLQLSRIHVNDDRNIRYKTVEEIDGAVRNVFLQLNPANKGCEALTHDLSDGRFAFGMMGDSWAGELLGTREGVIAGEIGTSKPVVLKQDMPPESTSHWYVSSSWLLEGRIKTLAHSWDLAETFTVYDPAQDPEGMPAHNDLGRGEAHFFQVDVAGYSGVMVWTQEGGPRPLIRWFGDYTQGAGNFNTDGGDMVWTHGEGKEPSSKQEYPVRSIMTAPFTTDAASVQATQRRLRSDPGQLSTDVYGIGCGYAGRVIAAKDLLVVRLSDGVSWTITGSLERDGVKFMQLLGFTCEELFAAAQYADDAVTVVRIPLASLGPGDPPD
jgi:hypothetical protein